MVPAMRGIVAGGAVLTAAAAGPPEGSVVRDIFAGASGSKPEVEGKPESTEAAVELMTGQIQTAFAILAAKATPDEVAAVRPTLEATAQAVVERLGSGFWGAGSEKVSGGEQAFLDRLAQVLETGTVPNEPAPNEPAPNEPAAPAEDAPQA